MSRRNITMTLVVAASLMLTTGAAWAKDQCRSKNTLGSADAADGTAELRVRDRGRASLSVEVEDLLPLGTYNVCVDGVRRGALTTFTFSRQMKGVGVLDFDSQPAEVEKGDADALLDFEAAGKSLEVVSGPCASGRVRLSITSLACASRR